MSDFLPLSIPYLSGLENELVNECLASGWVSTAGPWVNQFEREFAEKLHCRTAVSTSSGTAALHLALLAAGVQKGDIVLVPTVTFIASVNAISYVGAHPIFMDCDDSLNIDSNKVKRFLEEECEWIGEALHHRKTRQIIKAILPVHIFGHPVEMEPLLSLAQTFRLRLIEDAAESLGSYWIKNDEKVPTGTVGDLGCYSFNGNKIITSGGGGMIVGRNSKEVEHCRHLSTQAKESELFFTHDEVGYNYRLTSLQSALGIAQHRQLDFFVQKKRETFSFYEELFSDFYEAVLLKEPKGTQANYWLNNLIFHETIDLKGLIDYLQGKNIQTRPLWMLNHLQKPYRNCEAYQIEKATSLYPRILSIPSSLQLKPADLERVAFHVKEYFKR